MQLNILRGPLLLLVWQVAPVEVQPDSNGRYRVSFGYGRGQYEARQLNCAGNVVSARPVGFQASGAQVDAWPTTRIRFSAFGGVLSMDRGRYDGPFGGLLIAAEGQHVGIGAGPVHVSGSDSFTGPSLYLRLGNIDRPHFRFDVLPPSPTFGTTGYTHKRTFLLYDRRTESVWYPLESGEMNAIGGELAGRALPFLGEPSRVSLAEWRREHADSLVLVGTDVEGLPPGAILSP